MGTVKLTTLREPYLFYEKIYMEKDIDEKVHLDALRETIKIYKESAFKAKYNALKCILNLITISYREGTRIGAIGPYIEHVWNVKYSYIKDPMNPKIEMDLTWSWDKFGGTIDAEEKAKYEYNQRYKQVEAEYNTSLGIL